MIGTEHRHELPDDKLVVTAEHCLDGVNIRAYSDRLAPIEVNGVITRPNPLARAIASSAGGNIHLNVTGNPNSDRPPSARVVEAMAYYAATLGTVATEGQVTVGGGNIVILPSAQTQPRLEELGFPFNKDSSAGPVGAEDRPALPISDVYYSLGASFPGSFTGAHLVRPQQPLPEPMPVGAGTLAA